jgi:glycosyltransferase involved in cell wall biosynthesis
MAANPDAGYELRLGIYVDTVFRLDGERLFTNSEAYPFMLFVGEVARAFKSTMAIGRSVAQGAGTSFEMPAGIGLLPLPYYENLRRLGAVLRTGGRTVRAMWRSLDDLDIVWVFGPHPLGLLLALFALARGRRVVIGVRQDTMSYFRARLPSPAWRPVLAPLWLLDRTFRLVTRFVPAVVIGSELERAYGGPRQGLARAVISLTDSDQIVSEPVDRDWDGVRQLITVGRIEPEKNPILLVEALAELERRRPGAHVLRWVGVGRLSDEVRSRASELGVADRLELTGFVPYGPRLLELYRDAHMFVHVSHTEGSPQVLVEAMAAGIPVVATDVGSVRDLADGGGAAILIPPANLGALVEAVLLLGDDRPLRRACVGAGLEVARRYARDVEAARIARFIADPVEAKAATRT